MPVGTDSFLFRAAHAWQFPAFVICLGSSYMQRMLAKLPPLAQAAAACPGFEDYCRYLPDTVSGACTCAVQSASMLCYRSACDLYGCAPTILMLIQAAGAPSMRSWPCCQGCCLQCWHGCWATLSLGNIYRGFVLKYMHVLCLPVCVTVPFMLAANYAAQADRRGGPVHYMYPALHPVHLPVYRNQGG